MSENEYKSKKSRGTFFEVDSLAKQMAATY